jgi:hypothetical protein
MRHSYQDIQARIPEQAQWHDAHGVPRYTSFSPYDCPDPYAVEVLLMEITCQHCGREFNVEVHNGPVGDAGRLAKQITSGRITYGEPPHHDCPGDLLHSKSVRILRYHMRRSGDEWMRETRFEIGLDQSAQRPFTSTMAGQTGR